MKKKTYNNNIVKLNQEEIERIENEMRSNLRYSWQKAISFAISYKATIEEVMEKLEESFLMFIPINHKHRKIYKEIILKSFNKVLGKLYATEDISDINIEDNFINIAVAHLYNTNIISIWHMAIKLRILIIIYFCCIKTAN